MHVVTLESFFNMEDETDLLYGDLNEESLKSPMEESASNSGTNEEFEEKNVLLASSLQLKAVDSALMTPVVPIAMPFLHLYPIDNFTFGSKDAVMEIETSYHHRMAQLAESFKAEGMRRTVEAVLLTYQNNHPHVLLLQLGETNIFKL